MPDEISILKADTEADLADIRRLFRAYTDWLGIDLSYQGFEEELAGLPGKYVTPDGALFLARNRNGGAMGCIAMRPLEVSSICEMKRLYVAPEGRGLGIGKQLVEAIIQAAQKAGYNKMRLDTLPTMLGALKLYRNAGFKDIPEYYETPISETVFLELDLTA
ncbi:acetyltransferase [Roseibium sp. TrichSKD4]|uniref:GNAT family N-acetyltransferase n=1 Tax=Roseibium sp. TrichSKD4 TaxID=744980 RepID=UPI0001E567D2|nr:GNAT family N-acetyltransferase [Roseibium sp. TrichSKD4]EFO30509.1 acetyltransferase [Roseibium sp. TrichSKD4]